MAFRLDTAHTADQRADSQVKVPLTSSAAARRRRRPSLHLPYSAIRKRPDITWLTREAERPFAEHTYTCKKDGQDARPIVPR